MLVPADYVRAVEARRPGATRAGERGRLEETLDVLTGSSSGGSDLDLEIRPGGPSGTTGVVRERDRGDWRSWGGARDMSVLAVCRGPGPERGPGATCSTTGVVGDEHKHAGCLCRPRRHRQPDAARLAARRPRSCEVAPQGFGPSAGRVSLHAPRTEPSRLSKTHPPLCARRAPTPRPAGPAAVRGVGESRLPCRAPRGVEASVRSS